MVRKAGSILVATLMLTACAGGIQYPFGRIDMKVDDRNAVASFVQWTDDIAVTANHVTLVDGVVHACEKGCDLKFFKHKAEVPVMPWRNVVPDEPVVAVGLDLNNRRWVSPGKDLNAPVYDEEGAGDYLYETTTAATVAGMSGGPIYGLDKKVVGMTVGGATIKKNGQQMTVTMYIPYSLVKQEWDKYQNKLTTVASR